MDDQLKHKVTIAIDGIEVPLKLEDAHLSIDVEGGSLGRNYALNFHFQTDGVIEIDVLEDQEGDFEVVQSLSMPATELANLIVKLAILQKDPYATDLVGVQANKAGDLAFVANAFGIYVKGL